MRPTFFERLSIHAAERPEHAALAGDAFSLTYRDLLREVSSARANLGECGVGPGFGVGVSLGDEVDHLIAALALMAAGEG